MFHHLYDFAAGLGFTAQQGCRGLLLLQFGRAAAENRVRVQGLGQFLCLRLPSLTQDKCACCMP